MSSNSVRSAVAGGVAGALLAGGAAAIAANGGNFILGQQNDANQTTRLTSGVSGPALRVTSSSAASTATGLTSSSKPASPR